MVGLCPLRSTSMSRRDELDWEIAEGLVVSFAWVEVGVVVRNGDRRVDERVACEGGGEEDPVDP